MWPGNKIKGGGTRQRMRSKKGRARATRPFRRPGTHTPIVSVVMGVRDGERYLREAAESVLVQTLRDFEFIIIDDASSDGTASILAELAGKDKRIRRFRNHLNLGLTASLNKGIDASRGKYIARMDHDDVSLPERLEKQVRYLEDHPEIALVGTWAEIVGEDGMVIGIRRHPLTHEAIHARLMSRNQFIHPSVMMRRSALDAVGGYDERYRYSQDYDLFLRMAARFRVANLPEPLIRHRFSFGNYHNTKQKRQERYGISMRMNALLKEGYPTWQAIHLVKPILSYLVPIAVKKPLLRMMMSTRIRARFRPREGGA